MKIFRLLLATVILLSISVLVYWRLGENDPGRNFYRYLNKRYSDEFETQTLRVNGFQITVATGSGMTDILPVVAVFTDNGIKPVEIYEIDSYSSDMVKGFLGLEKWTKANVDADPEGEIISEWGLNWGGSDGLKSLVIFDVQGNKVIPVLGYPSTLKIRDDQIVVKDLKGNGEYRFPVMGLSSFTDYSDLNKDGNSELLYGDYFWDSHDPTESHFSPHFWDLSVYEFTDQGFQSASWWNDGQVYRTEKKIGFENADMIKLNDLFRSKVNVHW